MLLTILDKGRRRTAVLFVVLTVFIIIGSSVYEMAESEHECSGEDCPICLILHAVKEVKGKLGAETVFEPDAALTLAVFICVIKPVTGFIRVHTPVSDKVRLDS